MLSLQMRIVLSIVIAGAASAQTVSWVPAGSPPARCCMGMVYDGATHATVLFGGTGPGDKVHGDTWSWRGGWLRMSPATSPSPRQGPAMAYDGAAGNVVLFGGSTTAPVGAGTSLNDTWTWNGVNWTQQFPPVSPPARTWSSMAYDQATKTVVMFGGNTLGGGDGPLNDTWTWDGIAKTWTRQNPVNAPPARGSTQLVYDETNGTIVLFGGTTTNLTSLNDTWTWNGINWTQQFPASSPSIRNGPALAYDPDLRAVVLFSGATGACCSDNPNDTWTWNGSNWTQIFPANKLPQGRNSGGMDYDPVYRVLVLFGGSSSGPILGDTWLLTLAP